jgi:NAD+ synthase
MFSPEVLEMDRVQACDTIQRSIREQVRARLRRRGAVVGLSGGVDSAVVAALCARALGADRVLGLLMPERHSSAESSRLGRMVASHLGIPYHMEDLTPALTALGCYERQAEAIRAVVPEYGDGWHCKLSVPPVADHRRLSITYLTVASPSGALRTVRMPAGPHMQLVAATSFKQRLRKTMEYYHADRLQYAVAGTANRLEHDQAFFVKQGDGAADFKPIAHLYKTQVYALARHMNLPPEICNAVPTTDTYSLAQGQDEFYFALPYAKMDLALYALNNGYSAEELAPAIGVTPQQAANVFRDIEAKRKATRYMHLKPVLVEDLPELKL